MLIVTSLLTPYVSTRSNGDETTKPTVGTIVDTTKRFPAFNIKNIVYVDGDAVGSLSHSEPVTLIGIERTYNWRTIRYGDREIRLRVPGNIWYKVLYQGQVKYVSAASIYYTKPANVIHTYSDETCSITVFKEWYENAYVYSAHVKFTDYKRLGMECAYGKYNSGRETTSRASKRIEAILCVNGDYAVPGNGAGGYAIARNGVVCNDKIVWSEGIYNHNNGLLTYRTYDNCSGKQLSELVAEGKITDTFQFGPAFLLDGEITGVDASSTSRAQRTFIGTNGKPGDIWICVSDGRFNDGKSAGLNGYQCAAYLKSKGCTFGIPLDGGGSSAIVWNGTVLNAAKGNERAVVDFLYFK